MDGYRLGYEVRRSRDLEKTRIIVYSRTYTTMADERMALKAGADRFLRNPVGTEAILRALHEATRARRQAREVVPPVTESAAVREYSEVLVRRLEDANRRLEASRHRLAAANEAIRRSEERVRLLLDSTAEGIYGLDLEGNFTFCNAAALAMLGYAGTRELLGRNAHALVHHTRESGESYPRDESGVFRALREDRGSHAEDETLWRADGTSFPAESWSYPVRKDGVRVGTVVTFVDITERKQAEEALRSSERRFRSLTENSRDIVAIVELDGTIRYVNPSVETALGFRPEELVGKNAFSLVPPEDAPGLRSRMAEKTGSASSVAPMSFRLRHRDGSWRAFEAAGSRRDAATEDEGIVLTFRDVTDRRHAEKEMLRSEERFRKLFDSNTIGIAIADLNGNTLEANDAYLDMLGVTGEEVLAGKVNWSEMTPAEYAERDRISIEELRRTGVAAPWEKEILRKDGTRVPILIGVAMLEASEASVIAYIVDLTERRKLEGQFLQAQKMEAVGQLAGGVAHDFNNLLTVILGYCDLLAARVEPGSLQLEELGEIRKAGERAAGLTRQLLAFSRTQVLVPEVLDINSVVNEIDKMLRRVIGEDIDLRAVCQPEIGCVKADRGQLEQVLMNLAVNARDAMPRGGNLTIETRNVEVDDTSVGESAAMPPGSYVLLAVSDTGSGMKANTKSHLFEPFFTTKEKGQGTGLGLATVYGIVKQSGGFIWVYSEPGRGATFKIYLPRVERAPGGPAPRPAAAAPKSTRGTETVLLLEDEEGLRRLARDVLRKEGYTVLETSGWQSALEIAGQHPGTIHMVLTDVVMPGMGGPEVASRVSALRPGIKVLYMSGYTGNAAAHRGLLEASVALLQKPFTPGDLARRVRQVLDGS
jgi:PAS domain S-box-containing protein